MEDVLADAADRAIAYLAGIDQRPVRRVTAADLMEIGGPFPDGPTDPSLVVKLLDEVVSPATMAMAGPRFFGWVIGGASPVAVAADWLVSAWDQNTLFASATPGMVALEAAALRWVVEAAALPSGTWGAFVTGTTAANIAALSTASTAVLAAAGWDAAGEGLFGAPPVTVVAGADAHPSLIKALGVVGLGRNRVVTVPVDDQGRMRADRLPRIQPPAIVCVQAGNVNSGAFDPLDDIIPAAKQAGAWVHVDGAFGFWAAAAPSLAHLTAGLADADSWATDAHKFLNVPYDAGLVLVRNPSALERVMSVSASYLPAGAIGRDPVLYTPEMSRRARGVPTWAALKSLGRSGLAALIESRVALAQRFADKLQHAGFDILNDVVFNQVLVGFADREARDRIVATLQSDGTMFAWPTDWHGRAAMRISVCSWKTTADDVDRCVAEIVRAGLGGPPVGQ
ncbi:MAG: pyridoxal phosphate-dependent decarboxylase family protein [Acidimicrobiales bacterium]